MTSRGTGVALVAAQSVLMAFLLLQPGNHDFALPRWLATGFTLLSAAGLVMALAAFWTLGKARSALPEPTDSGALIVTGWYSVVRHPMYSLLIVTFLCRAVVMRSVAALIAWALLVVVFSIKARMEERLLAARYPEYIEYCRRVGRFIPRL